MVYFVYFVANQITVNWSGKFIKNHLRAQLFSFQILVYLPANAQNKYELGIYYKTYIQSCSKRALYLWQII